MIAYSQEDCFELQTINDFLRFAYTWANEETLFFGHGTDNPWDDVRQLILGSLSLPYDIPEALLNCRVIAKEKKYLFSLIEKRIKQKIPVPYLTHQAYFCDLPFYVDERVLIPRSPIAELIMKRFTPWVKPENVHRILDMCTGSACIAIACCYAYPDALVDAVDLSEDALNVAQINRDTHGVEEQLGLFQSDCFEQLPANKYDIIVSNPPYVGADEMQMLPDEYHYEPEMALKAEHNGLAIIEKILLQAKDYLSENGILVVEAGNSDELVSQAYPDLPLTWLEFERGGHGVFVLSSEQIHDYFSSKL